jgi:probable HAF family extracellular repeat protein
MCASLLIAGFLFGPGVLPDAPRFRFEKVELATPVNFYNPAGEVRLGKMIWDGKGIRPLELERANESGDGFRMDIIPTMDGGPCFRTVAHIQETNYFVSRYDGCSSFAYDINSEGEIVGTTDASPEDNYAGRHPYLFKDGTIYWLNNLIDGPVRFEYPLKINDQGVIYGVRDAYNDYAVVKLNPRLDGKYEATELARTAIGDVKISKAGGFIYQNQYWNGKEFISIGDFSAPERVYPVAINSAGQVLGHATEPNTRYNLFFWDGGKIHDLKDLVELPANWSMGEPFDLNEYGQILIYAFSVDGLTERLLLRLSADPAIRSVTTKGNEMTVRISPGRRERISLQSSSDFQSWSDVRTIQAPAPEETATIAFSSGYRYFRVVRAGP